MAVKRDAEEYGGFIRQLASEVQAFGTGDMAAVCAFVESLDQALAVLTDERAVLKGFEWPEAKVDAMREATALHREMQQTMAAIDGWTVGHDACEAECSRLSGQLDRVQRRIDQLGTSLEGDQKRFQEHGIPWDGKLVQQVKQKCLRLTTLFLERVLEEVERGGPDDPRRRARAHALLVGGVRFAFRSHQFVGGFDGPSLQRFERVSGLMKSLQPPAAAA